MNNVVTEMVTRDLCSGCGVCAGICPVNALSMRLRKNGDLMPDVDAGRCVDECRVCLDICPFSSGVHNPREKNATLFNRVSGASFDDDIGWYARSVVGFRKDKDLRAASASGGLATWCLEVLLKKRLVTRIAVVRVAENHDKGFFEFYGASSVDELRKSSGSIYHPVEISSIIKELESNGQDRWAIVGVPCLCAAIRNSSSLMENVPFVFGLACGMYQNTFYTEMLLAASGVNRDDMANIEYRRKSEGGLSSDYRFRGTDNRRTGKEIAYHGLPLYLGKHAFFRLNACNFCMDVFAETADACFMDAWLPEYRHESKGTSLVVIRDRRLDDLLLQGQSEGELQVEKINPEKVVLSQRGHVRRKRELIHLRRGVRQPKDAERPEPTTAEKMNWRLQKRIQKRSKKAWAEYGRKYGRLAFWLMLTDVLIMQCAATYVIKSVSFPSRMVAKLRRILSRYRMNEG